MKGRAGANSMRGANQDFVLLLIYLAKIRVYQLQNVHVAPILWLLSNAANISG
jgi:hypothetical protein